MKKITAIFISLVILLSCFVFPASAEVQIVKAGFFNFDGYHMINENGEKSGYGYDFLQMVGRYTDFNYEYIGYDKSWSDMLEMLEKGEIDVVTSAQKTPERLEKFGFSQKAIGTSSAILTVKSGNSRFIAGEYDTYKGMLVGLLENNSRNDSFSEFAAKNGFNYSYVYYADVEELEKALQDGKVDGIVTSSLRGITNEWVLDEFAPSDFYAIVRKDDKKLLSQIDYAINQMDINSSGWRTILKDKYYSAKSGEEIAYTSAEREFISQSKADGTVYKAVVNPDRAPYSYFENGTAKGIFIDLFNEVVKRSGIENQVRFSATFCNFR